MNIELSKLVKTVNFPEIKALPMKRVNVDVNIFKRMFTFSKFRREFQVLNNNIIWSAYLQEFILIPKVFIYDGASVPKILNSIYSPTGVLFYGACPHDFGYRYGGFLVVDQKTGIVSFKQYTKKEIDEVFNALCGVESNMKKASRTATTVLKLAGIPTWRSWRKEGRSTYTDFPEVYA